LKQDLLATGFVEAVSKSPSPMTGINSFWRGFSWAGKDPNSNVLLSIITTEYDYEKTSGIQIKDGRAFSSLFRTPPL
jgi:putative ABC transport system permease protein